MGVARPRRQRHALRAIALTAFAAEADVERSRAEGFDAHLTKPVNIELLADAVERLWTLPACA